MPLYEYQCSSCSQTYEQLRRMQDADRDLICPKCQSAKVQRQLSTFASHISASGGDMAPCGQPASACGNGGCCRH